MHILTSPDEVIDALGGTTAVASLFNVTPPAVSMWRKRGLPADTYVAFQTALAALDDPATAPPDLWNQKAPFADDVAA